MKGICTGVVAVAGSVMLAGVSYVLANEPKGEGPLIIVGPPQTDPASAHILVDSMLAFHGVGTFFGNS